MDIQTLLLTYLGAVTSHCAVTIETHGGLIGALFLTGLLGSATHCVGMCGPFVLAQTTSRLEAIPADRMREWHRLAGGALVPYHLGRLTTYTLLGGLVAGALGLVPNTHAVRIIGAALLVGAAMGFLGYALPRFGISLPWRLGTDSAWVKAIDRIARPLFARPVGWRGYLLGVALGFIPCGLIYAGLAAAAASADPLAGMFAMAAFAAGTMPVLIGVGVIGGWLADRWRKISMRLLPILFAANAVLLTVLAYDLARGPAQEALSQTTGGHFELAGPGGRTYTEADFRGRFMIVYFGYTFCPDVCPTSLATIGDALDRLSEDERARFAPIFITIDPDRDTPEILAEYVAHFHPSLIGLSGSAEQVAAAARAYHVYYAKVEGQGAAEYLMDHSTAIYLMGPDGRFIRHFAHDADTRAVADALHAALKETP